MSMIKQYALYENIEIYMQTNRKLMTINNCLTIIILNHRVKENKSCEMLKLKDFD